MRIISAPRVLGLSGRCSDLIYIQLLLARTVQTQERSLSFNIYPGFFSPRFLDSILGRRLVMKNESYL